MDNPVEIMRLCRLCLVKDQVNIPIFAEQGDIRQIFLKISSCLPVKVSRDDQLPKRICDGCSNKLDLLYEFWNTSANAEKTLLSWLGQAGVKDVDETISAVAQQIAKPPETQTQVKQEAPEDVHAAVQSTDHLELTDDTAAAFEENSTKDESDEPEPPPPKRARRTAAVKAQINIAPDSDEDDDDFDSTEPLTKIEDESDDSDLEKDPSYVDVPGTSADDQPGPSGVGKDGVEAPLLQRNACFVCDESFTDTKTLNNHLENVKAFVYLFCKTCNSTCNIRESEFHHDYVYFCAVCRQFLLGKYLSHMCLHKTKPQKLAERHKIRCSMCTEIFFSKGDLERHEVDCMSRDSNFYMCKCCNQQMFDEKSWSKHVQQLTQENEVNYVCCNNKFENGTTYKHHLQKVHLRSIVIKDFPLDDKITPKISCRFCDETFSNQNLTVAHERKTHGNEMVQCDVCFKYLKMERFRAHKITHRTKKHYYNTPAKVCNVCGLSVKNLERHLVIHENQRNHTCPHCEKTFKLSWGLKRHLVVHSDEAKHKCEICDKTFKVAFNLRVHMRIHDGIKPFPCMICDKSYTTKQSRDNHLKTHDP